MGEEETTENRYPTKRKGSTHDTVELFRAARFVAVPLPFLMPDYLTQGQGATAWEGSSSA